MTTEALPRAGRRGGARWPTAAVVALVVAAAAAADLLVYAVGRAAGGSFAFARGGRVLEVDAAGSATQ